MVEVIICYYKRELTNLRLLFLKGPVLLSFAFLCLSSVLLLLPILLTSQQLWFLPIPIIVISFLCMNHFTKKRIKSL